MPHIRKKAKTKPTDEDEQPKPCYITRLPFELIAEVLLYTQSPKDVLALARCNKFFCATLVKKSSDYIWRYTRTNCRPGPLPEPLQIFTEASYAAFVFDEGKCEECGRETKLMYDSFALRIRTCGQTQCRKQFAKTKLTAPQAQPEYHRIISESLLVPEHANCTHSASYLYDNAAWPNRQKLYRTNEWTAAVQEYLDASHSPEDLDAEMERRVKMAKRISLMMPSFLELFKWKEKYDIARATNKAANEAFAKILAAKVGYDYWDLMQAPSYARRHRGKNITLERVTDSDYRMIHEAVEAEILKASEARKQSKHEAEYRQSREIVEKHYERLRCKRLEVPLPPLASFRKIPIIHTIQTTPPSPEFDVAKQLQTPLVATLLKSELSAWRNQAKNALAATLGFANWKSASSKRLHPVDRINAHFRCKKCAHTENKYKEDGCFDFFGACSHQCSKKFRGKREWNVTRFLKDDKACAAVSKLADLGSINTESPESINAFEALDARVLCNSCTAAIVLQSSAVAGHSHRHEDMQMSLLLTPILEKHPLTKGLALRLMGPEDRAKVLRENKIYGCRHCLQVRTTSTEKPMQESGQECILTFNGLRSHLKAKHKVVDLRDEDFYCSGPLTWKEAGAAT
ncbi:uncharacterized protein BT62DRAFT_1074220 [Guyanagaster necrorhizus]|uniref:F-box domain-containing protein n=1 Tax=Guyanagaster necrorhizus TaxID=856835 RepID=A0A9P7VYN8_9AGAR|nr:uncharacterized protein BT62DRAFT_1074220 [Guyanagaster necrorhizus MCA 3950]KAG7448664.1 hypothetical protein BT62DRAFT_1074220 [Guyanagaster necrorhizus MCA 3950]